MNHADYAKIPGMNWSTLKHMLVSPRMFRFRLANPEPTKPAYRLGNAAHCAILEPDKFEARYMVLTAEDVEEIAPARSKTAGKAAWADYRASHPDAPEMTSDEYKAAMCAWRYPAAEIITASERDAALAMRDAVYEHPIARELLRGGLSEEIVTWTDEETGILCKSRLDYLRPDCMLDLKSTRDPAPFKFTRDAGNYGYVSQVGMYQDGAVASRRIDGKIRPYIIAVRSADDYDVAAYQIDPISLETGRSIYRSCLRKLADCTAADYWPGVAPELKQLVLPPWIGADTSPTDEGEEF